MPPSHPIFLLFRFHPCRTAAPPFFVPSLYFVTPIQLLYIRIIPETGEMSCVTLESRTVELCKVVSVFSRNSWSSSCPGETMPTPPPSPPTSLHPLLYLQQNLPATIPHALLAHCSRKDTDIAEPAILEGWPIDCKNDDPQRNPAGRNSSQPGPPLAATRWKRCRSCVQHNWLYRLRERSNSTVQNCILSCLLVRCDVCCKEIPGGYSLSIPMPL